MAGKHTDKKNIKFSNILIIIIRLICLIVMAYSLFKIYEWHKENVENQNLKNSFSNVATDDQSIIENRTINTLNINFDELLKRNPQTVGWVKVNNTNINYPVVQYSDNSYYLTHNFENKYNSSGWIFLDYRNNIESLDPNTIVYGHNRRNDSMFGTLKNALNTSWCDNMNNRYIFYSTPKEAYIAKIFSVYKIDVNNLSISTNFSSVEEYKNFLDTITNKSYYNFNTPVTTDDKILTLYTCDDNTSYRVIVHAKFMENN